MCTLEKKALYRLGPSALLLALTCLWIPSARTQTLLFDSADGLYVEGMYVRGMHLQFESPKPFFSLLINNAPFSTAEAAVAGSASDALELRFSNGVVATLKTDPAFSPGWKAEIRFTNDSDDTLKLENVVPFGISDEHPHITASGPWSLARTKLYRPGESPIGVILPDNAWEMGYASVPLLDGRSVAAIARRTGWEDAERTRWHTRLEPGGTASYVIYADIFAGPWQNGLRMMFRDRFLYDLHTFDESLYEREDLQWIRDAYVAVLQAAWDRRFYDRESGQYVLDEFLDEGKYLFGGYDVYAIWPTWPRLGLDPRNQWDLYRDLPGGLSKLNDLAESARSRGTRFFISYNPWDQSTRTENPYRGMATLIDRIGVDGVVLDTRGSSSDELQAAADSVRKGVVMYSEGMAVPKDMPDIISGRVHDAILVPPPLNLNKLIRPEFAIFRVAQLAHETVHRDVATSFFNGYGVEINTFRPSRPPDARDDYLFMGEAARILRTNSDAFHSREWTPLIDSKRDSIWVNEFPGPEKTIYTIFSLVPAGHRGALFRVEEREDRHYVDLWHHEALEPDTLSDGLYLPMRVDGFDALLLHTQEEGIIGAVGALPKILTTELRGDTMHVDADRGDLIKIWAGNPSYQSTPHEVDAGTHDVVLYDVFGSYQGKFVVELFEDGRLLDERIVTMSPETARLISTSTKDTSTYEAASPQRASVSQVPKETPQGMVFVPAATIAPALRGNGADGTGIIHYPSHLSNGASHHVDAFYIDRYPVTNSEYKEFLDATGYEPADTTNFVRHWDGFTVPAGLEDHPVANVSLEDAQAYARWAGKRLPTELEWQLAAQGTDGRIWPWGDSFDSTRVNVEIGHTTPVDAYPEGESPYGVRDLVGNVWQLTSDVYSEGDYRFVMIRGGSFYNPTSSWWYMKNGPRPLDTRQVLLLVAPGFDRSATVGFRCAADAREQL